MKPDDKQEIIENFRHITHPKLLLAVMGGIFSEGVDFIGNMCIGVIIFSPAIPAPTFERELIREYYANKNEAGFDYAYTFPAMNKVIQAVGRLIRTPKDKGVIVLVGERFSEENIQTLFPEEWFFTPYNLEITDQYENSIKAFWEKQH
jgi:Rad3-related DNA helicase